ncbi:MAG: hypothetical protein CL663_03415 [Bacteroidetes bacterium]|nr:hypothetical protein [Bacteroidota bacterium]
MKKLIVLIALLSCTALNAQELMESDYYVKIKSGVAIPLGDFAGNTLYESAFADPGFFAGIDVGWKAFDRLGFIVSGDLAINPVRASDLGAAKVAADPFLIDLRTRSEPFKVFSAMGGLTYDSEIFKYLNINSFVSIGMAYGETPYTLYKSQYFLTGPDYFEITPAGSYGFAYKIGADLEYDIKTQWGTFVGASYMHTKFSFKFITNGGTGERIENKKVDLLNVVFGIRLKL